MAGTFIKPCGNPFPMDLACWQVSSGVKNFLDRSKNPLDTSFQEE